MLSDTLERTMSLPIPLLLFLSIATLLPLAPLRRSRVAPVITIALIVVNLFVYFTNLSPDSHLPTNSVLDNWGLKPKHPHIIALFSYMFLHGDTMHVLSNVIILGLFGRHIEEALGKVKYILLYLGSGIAAGLFYVLMTAFLKPEDNEKIMIGASGAIFGLLGMFAVRFWRTRVRLYLLFAVPGFVAIGLFTSYQILMSIFQEKEGGVAYMAHIGGFLFGSLISWPLQMKKASKREYDIEDAEAAVKGGDWELAGSYYTRLLENAPHDPGLNRARAQVFMRQDEPNTEAAMRHLRDAISGYLQKGEGIEALKTYQEALERLEELSDEKGKISLGPTLLSKLASVCEGLEQFGLAVDFLTLLCHDYPNAPETEAATLRLGRLHLTKLGQPQTSLEIFTRFMRLYPHSSLFDHARQLKQQAENNASRV